MLDDFLKAGSLISGAAIGYMGLQYLSGRPFKTLAQGKGIIHPGVLNIGRVGVGEFLGRRLLSDTSRIARYVPQGLRAGVARGLMRGPIFTGALGFDPRTADPARIARISKLGRTLRLGGLAATVGLIAMPLAYSAGRGVVQVAQTATMLMGGAQHTDWGSPYASALMLSHAATERQRAIQVLEQAGVVGHNYMGKEAAFYHQ